MKRERRIAYGSEVRHILSVQSMLWLPCLMKAHSCSFELSRSFGTAQERRSSNLDQLTLMVPAALMEGMQAVTSQAYTS